VVNLVNMFNPEVVILGGIFAELHAVAGEQILAGLRDMALSPAHARVDLVVPQLGCDSILLGAAETAFAPLISDPTLAPFLPDVEGVAPRSPRTAAVD
jgi:predicted NBD/HSP70 family sugar kinase